jgi:hypothetical protein
MNSTPDEFIDSYLNDEYNTWVSVHNLENYSDAEKCITKFEMKYFGDEVYSDISRPGDVTAADLKEFRSLISNKHKRHLFCIKKIDDSAFFAVLGSVYYGKSAKFELVKVSESGDGLKIVSSYLTNFDDTFSYSAGEYLGEYLDDPCLNGEEFSRNQS